MNKSDMLHKTTDTYRKFQDNVYVKWEYWNTM